MTILMWSNKNESSNMKILLQLFLSESDIFLNRKTNICYFEGLNVSNILILKITVSNAWITENIFEYFSSLIFKVYLSITVICNCVCHCTKQRYPI